MGRGYRTPLGPQGSLPAMVTEGHRMARRCSNRAPRGRRWRTQAAAWWAAARSTAHGRTATRPTRACSRHASQGARPGHGGRRVPHAAGLDAGGRLQGWRRGRRAWCRGQLVCCARVLCADDLVKRASAACQGHAVPWEGAAARAHRGQSARARAGGRRCPRRCGTSSSPSA